MKKFAIGIILLSVMLTGCIDWSGAEEIIVYEGKSFELGSYNISLVETEIIIRDGFSGYTSYRAVIEIDDGNNTWICSMESQRGNIFDECEFGNCRLQLRETSNDYAIFRWRII